MKKFVKIFIPILLVLVIVAGAGALSNAQHAEKQIVRIGHNQSQTHPTHKALMAFKEYVESKLGINTKSRSIQVNCLDHRLTWYSLHRQVQSITV